MFYCTCTESSPTIGWELIMGRLPQGCATRDAEEKRERNTILSLAESERLRPSTRKQSSAEKRRFSTFVQGPSLSHTNVVLRLHCLCCRQSILWASVLHLGVRVWTHHCGEHKDRMITGYIILQQHRCTSTSNYYMV